MNSHFYFGVWISALAAGMLWLCDYSTKPSQESIGTGVWPSESSLEQGAGLSLLVFLHPKCPCSRATLRQLERALTSRSNDGELDVNVVLFCPAESPDAWVETDLWRHGKQLGTIHVDRSGEQASLFGAITSGHVFLFEKGQRVFDGGITSGRGHDGDAPGLLALCSRIQKQSVSVNKFPVFGCELKPAKGESL